MPILSDHKAGSTATRADWRCCFGDQCCSTNNLFAGRGRAIAACKVDLALKLETYGSPARAQQRLNNGYTAVKLSPSMQHLGGFEYRPLCAESLGPAAAAR
jgi:hypothetical protein